MVKLPHTLAVILGIILAALEAIQQAALTTPTWAHATIAAAIVTLAALGIIPTTLEDRPRSVWLPPITAGGVSQAKVVSITPQRQQVPGPAPAPAPTPPSTTPAS